MSGQGPDAPADRPVYMDRTTLAMASTILVVTSFAGLVFAPPGIILGPVIDKFITPHLLAKRGYVSPGPPLWSVAVGGLSYLFSLAAGVDDAAARDQALLSAIASGFGAVILGLIAVRGPLRRMGLIGIALGVGAVAFAIILHAQASP
jgi:hypothetical protein